MNSKHPQPNAQPNLTPVECAGCEGQGTLQVMTGAARQVELCAVCHGSRMVLPATNAVFEGVRAMVYRKLGWPMHFRPSNRPEQTAAPAWMYMDIGLVMRLRGIEPEKVEATA